MTDRLLTNDEAAELLTVSRSPLRHDVDTVNSPKTGWTFPQRRRIMAFVAASSLAVSACVLRGRCRGGD